MRLGPLFDISEARPGESPEPIIVVESLWIGRVLSVIWTCSSIVVFYRSTGAPSCDPIEVPHEHQHVSSTTARMRGRVKKAVVPPGETIQEATQSSSTRSIKVFRITVVMLWLSLSMSLFLSLGQAVSPTTAPLSDFVVTP